MSLYHTSTSASTAMINAATGESNRVNTYVLIILCCCKSREDEPVHSHSFTHSLTRLSTRTLHSIIHILIFFSHIFLAPTQKLGRYTLQCYSSIHRHQEVSSDANTQTFHGKVTVEKLTSLLARQHCSVVAAVSLKYRPEWEADKIM
jgi:hypothetical protein